MEDRNNCEEVPDVDELNFSVAVLVHKSLSCGAFDVLGFQS